MSARNDSSEISSWTKFTRSARPRQWIKNSFILAPALFTLKIFESQILLDLLLGFSGFSLIASAIYISNDILNRDEDARHPVKHLRPIASGQFNIRKAGFCATALFLVGISILYLLSSTASIAALAYALLMFVYSVHLRKIMILDVIIVASGFVIRVILGALIIKEPVSHWLILCTFTIALYLAMIKRRQEIVYTDLDQKADRTQHQTRSVLNYYPAISVIDGWINVLSAMTILCYALYTVDPITIAKHHTGYLIYTLPLVLYGVFRYQHLALFDRGGEDPTGLVLKDTGIKIVVIIWVIVVAFILMIARGMI